MWTITRIGNNTIPFLNMNMCAEQTRWTSSQMGNMTNWSTHGINIYDIHLIKIHVINTMNSEVNAVRWMATIHKTISASSHFWSRQSTEVLACVEFSCYSSDATCTARRSFSHFSATNIPVECTSSNKRTTQTAIQIYWNSVELFVVCVYCFKLTLFMHTHKFRRKASPFHTQRDPSSHVEIVM